MNTFDAMRCDAIKNFRSGVRATVGKQQSRALGAMPGGLRWPVAALVVVMLVAAASSSEAQNVAASSVAAAAQVAGDVESWGFNGFGQLGTGDFSRQLTPVLSGAKSDFVQISSTTLADWTLARKSDGTVWAWGRNIEGELADGTFTNRPSPVQVAPNSLTGVVLIAASAGAGAALKSDGTVWTWGDNSFGQGGGGTIGGHFPYASPIVNDINGKPFTGVTAILGGGGHLLALKNDGTVWAWGFNQFGGAGNFHCTPPPGTCNHVPAPFQIVDAAGKPFTGVVAMGAGGGHSLAIKSDGTVWAWGYNGFGQIGNGTAGNPFGNPNNDAHTPVQVNGVANAVAVTGGENWSMALLKGGTVQAWGFNDMGQLGNGTLAPRPVAGPVLSAGPGSAPLGNVKAIAAASLHALALLGDGTLKAWGQNDDGEGGNGTTTIRELTPLPVSLLTNVIEIAVGHSHDLAIVPPVPPVPPSADVAITKTGSPDEVSVGQNITYTLSVTNHGPDDATNVTVTDSLPRSVNFVFAGSRQGSCSGTSAVICNLGTLAKGATATVTIVVEAGAATNPGHPARTVTNIASVAATENDPTTSNNRSRETTTVWSASSNCKSVTGQLKEVQVSPPPALRTKGTFSGEGGIRGRYNFTLTKSSSTGDSTIASILQFVGHSTVTTTNGVIRFTEAGAIDSIAPGRFGDVMTITGGTGDYEDATGQLVLSGNYSLSGGRGESTYQGLVCTPRVGGQR